MNEFVNLDSTGNYMISTRVRCGRSISAYSLNPCMTEDQYKDMEAHVAAVLNNLEGDLKKKHHPWMDEQTKEQLIKDHYLFKEGDRLLHVANACSYWPTGRGIFLNNAETFLVCNIRNHPSVGSSHLNSELIAKKSEAIAKHNLHIRDTRGGHTVSEGSVYDISNKHRLNLELIKNERALELTKSGERE
ncbi:arginine kinase [Tropilaelaps mercedesae]|uniref:arginine kinase n=1 Tax=Tropilaelaps mercedesae TaxID=418985 RepID=A0A1V9XMZ6_9ACAR|nr:arginine kinase [Tropilaelaps mercedesae]